MFAVITGLLCLLAIIFVVWPLFSARRARSGPVHDATSRALYRARLLEVVAETQDTQLSQELQDELGAVFLSEQVQGAQVSSAADEHQSFPSRRWPLVCAALSVPVCAVLIYFQVSDPYLPTLRGAEVVINAAFDDTVELESWQKRLSQRVADYPTDHMSWYLLGHTHLKLGQYEAASEAFATTHALGGDDLNVLLYWLESRYLQQRGLLDALSLELADKLLAQHPDFPVVLEMLALDAFRRGDHARAVKYLHRAMTSTQDADNQRVFATAIEQVREQMSEKPPGITVQVSSTAALPKNATVFVIARPVGGGMPFAVVKRAATAVPFSARLDDLVAMNEDHLLGNAEGYEVVVRLTHSGQVNLGAPVVSEVGKEDWLWTSGRIKAGSVEALAVRLAPPAPK